MYIQKKKASAIDDVDGDISANVVITGNVDTSIPDTYIITYDISDSAGNLHRL